MLPHCCSSSLKGVTERPVADVVQKGGEKRNALALAIAPPLPAGDDIGQLAGDMIDADAVGEAAVGRTWKDQIGKPQLANAAQPLELARVEQTPRDAVDLIPMGITAAPKDDEPVDRVSETLRLAVA